MRLFEQIPNIIAFQKAQKELSVYYVFIILHSF